MVNVYKAKKQEQLCFFQPRTTIDSVINLYFFKVFNGGNKRAAVIFANRSLIGQAIGLFVIPEKGVPEFKRLLVRYYEDKNTGEIMRLMRDNCWRRIGTTQQKGDGGS